MSPGRNTVPLYREQGVVLRTYKLGEADRILVILTRGRGKVRAVAKGVRKTGSKFGARLDPTSHVALQLYTGRELDVVTQAETLDAFRSLREHLGALTAALAMLEATDQVAQEREPNAPLYQMLVGALRVLAAAPSPVVAPAFFWKLLSLEGFHPQLEACITCGVADGLVALHPEAGGARCAGCADGEAGPQAAGALALVRRIVGGDLGGALGEPDGPVVREVERLGVRALEHHLERRLRAAPLLASR